MSSFEFAGKKLRAMQHEIVTINCDKEDKKSVELVYALDVAKILNYRDSTDLSRNVKEKYVVKISTDNVPHKLRDVFTAQEMSKGLVMLTEFGVYEAVMKSRVPEAEKFQDYVYEVVLPALRRGEAINAKPPQPPKMPTMLELAEQVVELLKQQEANAPKVDFHDMHVDNGWMTPSTAWKKSGVELQREFMRLLELHNLGYYDEAYFRATDFGIMNKYSRPGCVGKTYRPCTISEEGLKYLLERISKSKT